MKGRKAMMDKRLYCSECESHIGTYYPREDGIDILFDIDDSSRYLSVTNFDDLELSCPACGMQQQFKCEFGFELV